MKTGKGEDRPRRTRAAAGVLLLLAAGLPAALLSRGGARLDSSNERLVFVCSEPDLATGHARTPHCSGWGERAGRRVWMSYNALGLRDKDYPPKPAPGVLRILATGGSVVVGSGLEEKDSPPRALERALRARGVKAEVVNAAGEGFTTWQNAVRLKDYLDAYSPQAVIYFLPSQYVMTDRSWWSRMRRVDRRVIGIKRPYEGFIDRLPENWRPYARRLFAVYVEQWLRIETSWRLAAIRDPAEKLDDLLSPTRKELWQMDRACREAGARFYVVTLGEELNADYYVLANRPPLLVRAEQRFMIRQFRIDGALVAPELRKYGLTVLNLSADKDALLAADNKLPGDYHWNERGAALLGDAIARAFIQARAGVAPKAPRP